MSQTITVSDKIDRTFLSILLILPMDMVTIVSLWDAHSNQHKNHSNLMGAQPDTPQSVAHLINSHYHKQGGVFASIESIQKQPQSQIHLQSVQFHHIDQYNLDINTILQDCVDNMLDVNILHFDMNTSL